MSQVIFAGLATVMIAMRLKLRVFRPETELRRAMAELGAILAFGLPLAGVLSAAGGYLIAHRSCWLNRERKLLS
jgi:hypothetical protein